MNKYTHQIEPDIIEHAFYDIEEAHSLVNDEIKEVHGEKTKLASNVHFDISSKKIEVPFKQLFMSSSDYEIIWTSTHELINQLNTSDHKAIEKHAPHLKDFDWKSYLRMNAIRVLHLYRELQSKGFYSGSILEVGSYFGSFALPLTRLGYDVTVVDRYDDYGEMFSPFIQLMEKAKINIISTTREKEEGQIKALDQFNCVCAMAVIEHIPHTPRLFLTILKNKIKSGGLLAIDTPNLASYWNRNKLMRGETIFQGVRHQFYSDIPFEGHHREYTGYEIEWMLKELDFKDVIIHYFDYNMFQFETLEGEHIDCLIKMLEDPTYCGLILAIGRKTG